MFSRFSIIVMTAAGIGLFACSTDKKSKSGGSSTPGATDVVDTTEVKEDVEGGSLPGIEWGLVKFDFVSPGDPEDIVGNQVNIEVSHNLPPIATWSLFYNKSFKSTEGGIAIAENQAATATKFTWNIVDMEPGNYFLFAVIKYGDVQNVRFYSSAIPVEDTEGDNRTPFMSLVTNLGAQVIVPGTNRAIQFIGVDPDGDDVLFGLDYSVDDGTTWVSIFKDITPDAAELVPDPANPGQVTYDWALPAGLAQGARYRVRLTGKDTKGKVGEAVMEKFGVSPAQVTYTSNMRTIFNAKCVSCHGAGLEPNPSQGLRLDYYDRVSGGLNFVQRNQRNGPQNRTTQIRDRTVNVQNPALQMPPGGGLTQAELDLFQLWVWGNFGQGTQQPNATLSLPAAATALTSASVFTITYTPTDADSAQVTTIIQYRLNNTGDYLTVMAARQDTTGAAQTFDWTVPTVVAITPVSLRVQVDDGTGRYRTITQDNLTITP